VGDDAAGAVAQVALGGVEVEVGRGVEGAEPQALRPVEEPGDVVGEVEEVAELAALEGEADLLAAAEEVLGVDGELAEEAIELAPAAAELELGALGLVALEDQVDLLVRAVVVDLDRVLLVELEVPELVDLG